MMRTDEENERDAYAAGQYRLSDAFSRIIDLEQERLRLRDLLRDRSTRSAIACRLLMPTGERPAAMATYRP